LKNTKDKPEPGKTGPAVRSEGISVEDLVLKTAAQYFGNVLLPYLGISGKLTFVAPTEQVVLEARHMYEDFNYATEMENSWIHLEFESDSVKTEDLRRFREYEATTSRTYHVAVTTYVICSSQVKSIKRELREGINTYRVRIIRLKDRSADQVFEELFAKRAEGKRLEREDLVPMLLTSLMSGKLSQKERALKGMRLLQAETGLGTDEIKKMQSVLYALASKFLERAELDDVKEVMTMTILGQMLMEDGMIKGRVESIIELLEELGTVPCGLKELIGQQKDLETLKRWHKLASKSESIEAFEKKYESVIMG